MREPARSPDYAPFDLCAKYRTLISHSILSFLNPSFRHMVDQDQLVNDTMFDLLRAIETNRISIKKERSIGSLCITIARRKTITAVRHCRRGKRIDPAYLRAIDSTTMEICASKAESPHSQAEANEFQDILFECLDKRKQSILQMVLDGFRIEEIAVAHQVTTKTIRRQKIEIKKIVFDKLSNLHYHHSSQPSK